MDIDIILVIVVIVVALGFDYTNGFHDAANAIATSVSTRALSPRAALTMAAIMNLLGAFLGTQVATTIAEEIVNLGSIQSHEQLIIVLAALVGAVTWNLTTWWFGLPSSSTHALIGGLAGAGMAAMTLSNYSDVAVKWDKILEKVIIPMVTSPLIGFVIAYIVMVAVLWIFKNASPHRAFRRFRIAQTASAAAMALGHGLQDAQKTMGIIFMALIAVGWAMPGEGIPNWVKVAAALAISAGTYSGGWRIMRTLGRKIIELDPARGFVAETVAAGVLYWTAYVGGAPISTTHTITSAIMGVGATKRVSAVRWGVAGNIVVGWVLTMPAAGLVAALMFYLAQWVLG